MSEHYGTPPTPILQWDPYETLCIHAEDAFAIEETSLSSTPVTRLS